MTHFDVTVKRQMYGRGEWLSMRRGRSGWCRGVIPFEGDRSASSAFWSQTGEDGSSARPLARPNRRVPRERGERSRSYLDGERKIDDAKLETERRLRRGARQERREKGDWLISLHIVADQMALAKAHGGYDECADGSKAAVMASCQGESEVLLRMADGDERADHEQAQKMQRVQARE